ncbi:MAG TPA: hypothetical protein VED41_02830 [Solirubrobacteraceae bacterium]|nr:hypothetical protein [Solirubrobacteraceae bacterium]
MTGLGREPTADEIAEALKKLQNIRKAQKLRDDVGIASGFPLRTLGHRT